MKLLVDIVKNINIGWRSRHEAALRLLPAAVAVAVCAGVSTSCKDEAKNVISGDFDPEHFATMTTVNVTTLISDSGVTRYRIDTPLWLMFDEAKEPRWTFPEGVKLEKYDDLFRRDASVECDSATFFKDKQLWRLDGYVAIENMAGEKFLTPQLYWDQRHQKIYSDSFIHIERADRIIEGYGFESNERMTNYHVKHVSGISPADECRGGPAEDAPAETDSVATTPQGGPLQQRAGGVQQQRNSERRPSSRPVSDVEQSGDDKPTMNPNRLIKRQVAKPETTPPEKMGRMQVIPVNQ